LNKYSETNLEAVDASTNQNKASPLNSVSFADVILDVQAQRWLKIKWLCNVSNNSNQMKNVMSNNSNQMKNVMFKNSNQTTNKMSQTQQTVKAVLKVI